MQRARYKNGKSTIHLHTKYITTEKDKKFSHKTVSRMI